MTNVCSGMNVKTLHGNSKGLRESLTVTKAVAYVTATRSPWLLIVTTKQQICGSSQLLLRKSYFLVFLWPNTPKSKREMKIKTVEIIGNAPKKCG